MLAGFKQAVSNTTKLFMKVNNYSSMLETTADYWAFCDQFQHMANQNLFWSGQTYCTFLMRRQ